MYLAAYSSLCLRDTWTQGRIFVVFKALHIDEMLYKLHIRRYVHFFYEIIVSDERWQKETGYLLM